MALSKVGQFNKIAVSATALKDAATELSIERIVEPQRSDCLYFRARAISAGDQGPKNTKWNFNGNFDYFARKELEAAYKSFVGRNLFLNHDTSSPLRAVGKVLDSYPVEDPETHEFYIECLARIDRQLHSELTRMIENGDLNSVSMGASCESSKCSICGHLIHSDQDLKCSHLSRLGQEFPAEIDLPEYGIKQGESVPAFSINSGLTFSELSIVSVPADSAALIKTVIASFQTKLTKIASKQQTYDTRALVAELDTLLSLLPNDAREEVRNQICASVGKCRVQTKVAQEVGTNLCCPCAVSACTCMCQGKAENCKCEHCPLCHPEKAEEVAKMASNNFNKIAKLTVEAAAYDVLIWAMGQALEQGEQEAMATTDLLHAMQEAGFSVGRMQEGKPGERQIFYTALHSAQAKGWVAQVEAGVYTLTDSGKERYQLIKTTLGEDIVPGKGRLDKQKPGEPESTETPSEMPAAEAPAAPEATPPANLEEPPMTQSNLKPAVATTATTVKADDMPPTEAPMPEGPQDTPEAEKDAVENMQEAKEHLEKAEEALDKALGHEEKEVKDMNEPPSGEAEKPTEVMEIMEASKKPTVTAKFTRHPFLSRSYWIVFANEKPIIQATLREICGEHLPTLKTLVTSEEYGTRLISRVTSDGPFKVASLLNVKADDEASTLWGADLTQKAHEKANTEVIKAHEATPKLEVATSYEPGDHLVAKKEVRAEASPACMCGDKCPCHKGVKMECSCGKMATEATTSPEVQATPENMTAMDPAAAGCSCAGACPCHGGIKMECGCGKMASEMTATPDTSTQKIEYVAPSTTTKTTVETTKVEASKESPETLSQAEKPGAHPQGPSKGQDWEKGKNLFKSDKVPSDEAKQAEVGKEAKLEKGEQTLSQAEGGPAAHPRGGDEPKPLSDKEKTKEVGKEAKLESGEETLDKAEKPAAPDAFSPPMGSPSNVKSDEQKAKEVGKEAELQAELDKASARVRELETTLQAKASDLMREKFERALESKTGRCKKLVEAMVQKEVLAVDNGLVEKYTKEGQTLLDARQSALKETMDRQLAAFMQMPDDLIRVQAETIQRIKKSAGAPSNKLSIAPHNAFTIQGDSEWMESLPWS